MDNLHNFFNHHLKLKFYFEKLKPYSLRYICLLLTIVPENTV